MIPFVDLSSNNQHSGIDWPTLAKYLLSLHPEAGVIIKVSEGVGYVNPYLHSQRMGAHAAGIKSVGLYHFDRASQASGRAQAEYYMKCIGDDGGVLAGEFPCWDEEDAGVDPSASLDAEVLDATGAISRAWGTGTIFYSGRWYTVPHDLTRDPKLASLGLWWAAPGSNLPSTPEPWASNGKSILFWQHDWHGLVPGVEGEVDLNYLVGDISTLRPYQWGFQPDPLAGLPVNVPPDVSIDPHSESFADMQTIAKHIADLASLGDVSKLPIIKADADLLVTMSWGH